MASAIDMALKSTRAFANHVHDSALRMKAAGGSFNFAPSDGFGQISNYQQQGANKRRYSLFRGWVHSAINALAMRGSKQPAFVGKLQNKAERKGPKNEKAAYTYHPPVKSYYKSKTAEKERQVIPDHPFQAGIDRPNPFQTRSQFVYSHFANLCLTGWSFVVAESIKGDDKDGKKKGNKEQFRFYSLPTTWVTPIHDKGLFAQFRIQNPSNPSASAEILERSQVAFCCLPDPSDPLAALALTQAQAAGIKIDDSIQSSQSVFFENGVFPSVLITMGTNPHPDVPGGMYRPRLTAGQRRQVIGAIRKVSAGIANYGNPAIIDGLIEKIERLSATQNEMGWEKSEKSVRTRILSAFGVHPFIMGEEAAGSYAAAYQVERVFCERVNFFLSALSDMMSGLAGSMTDDEDLKVWWEEAEAKDKQQESNIWDKARARGDVSQNEFREWLGLPPDPDGEQAEIDRQALAPVTAVATAAASGAITPEQAKAILIGLGLTPKLAKDIAGKGPDESMMGGGVDQFGNPLPPGQAGLNGQPPQNGQKPSQQAAEGEDDEDDEDTVEFAAAALGKAATLLSKTYDEMADDILASVESGLSTDLEQAAELLESLTD